MKALVICRLPDTSLEILLEPMMRTGRIEHIHLLRSVPYPFGSDRISRVEHRVTRWIPFAHLRRFIDGFLFLCRNRVDFIFSVHIHPHGYIGWVLSRLFRTPFVLNVIASHREFTAYGPGFSALNRFLLRSEMLFAVTGHSTVDYLRGRGVHPCRIFHLPNVIDMDRFTPEGRERTHDLVMVARLDENKNGYVLFRALKRLEDSGIRLTLRIAGDGPSAGKYRDTVDRLGIGDRVEFLGRVSSSRVRELLLESRVFILPSRGEGFPLALLEAMASGTPAVCTPVGDIPDVVKHGVNGMILSDPDDDEELASHLRSLFTDSTLCSLLRENALKARENYSFSSSAIRWGHMLDNLGTTGERP